ncbi:hypothetical protein GOP47_0020390 [Adiantum capillus-veneris]|uniref:Phosphatidylinositol N-acetylglucosaminyltransferase subunit Y n=1 Tax=Adiantum capillus-veneris TaxID=13818 RepID=A0A9D4Z9F3_ADICA|nr:hypothetical protein GOP47_0020390 [Adiantum capillus-veneris]
MEARPDLAGLFRLPTLSHRSRSSPHLLMWGSFLISIGILSFLAFLYAVVLSKLLPSSRVPFLTALENDWYYCLLVPLTGPVVIIAVYLHWLSMKLFKHA